MENYTQIDANLHFKVTHVFCQPVIIIFKISNFFCGFDLKGLREEWSTQATNARFCLRDSAQKRFDPKSFAFFERKKKQKKNKFFECWSQLPTCWLVVGRNPVRLTRGDYPQQDDDQFTTRG